VLHYQIYDDGTRRNAVQTNPAGLQEFDYKTAPVWVGSGLSVQSSWPS
jgi:hypothetical protein